MKEMKIYHATEWLKYEKKVIMSKIYLSVSKGHNYSYSDAVKVWPRFHSKSQMGRYTYMCVHS